MKTIHIFHQIKLDYSESRRQLTPPNNLTWVAAVRVPNDLPDEAVREAVRLTTGKEWWQNDGVIGVPNSRGSLAGDFFVVSGGGEFMLRNSSLESLPNTTFLSAHFPAIYRNGLGILIQPIIERAVIAYPLRSKCDSGLMKLLEQLAIALNRFATAYANLEGDTDTLVRHPAAQELANWFSAISLGPYRDDVVNGRTRR